MTRPHICFVALNAYPALSGRTDITHIGGAEVQQVIIARELVNRGYPVSFVTLDHGQTDGIAHDGIRVFRAYRRETGWRGLRFIHPRLTGLWTALKRTEADIYYQRMAEATTGIVAVFCRAYRRPFVFALAHNYNCKPDLPALPRRRDKWLYRYGLRHADAVISQTRFQQHMLRKHFDVESVVIPNCGLDLANAAQEAEDKANQPTKRVLWIGRFSREKRLDILLDVAERCPDVQFDVVGDTDGKQPAMDALKAQAQHISHIRLHGLVPHSKIACFYHKAHLLLCTSDDEGFPNTFIEAWSCGVPVVTTFDPDGVVARCTAGAVAADASGLVSSMRDLLQSQHWRESSQRARHLFDQHHTIGQVTQHIEQLILSLAR